MLQEANAVDKADDERFGADRRGDELPEELQRYDYGVLRPNAAARSRIGEG